MYLILPHYINPLDYPVEVKMRLVLAADPIITNLQQQKADITNTVYAKP